MSEDTKDNIKFSLLIGGIILGAVAFMIGFVSLINWKEEQYKKQAEEGCSRVAELSGVNTYKIDSDYNCFLVKDGKLETVKDW